MAGNKKDNYACGLVSRYESLENERANWKAHWEELTHYVMPKHSPVYKGGQERRDRENGRYDDIYDATAQEGVSTSASGFFTFICPPSEPWFDFIHSDKTIRENSSVKEWLNLCAERVREILIDSNFYQQIHEALIDYRGLGTSVFLSELHPEKPGKLTFKSFSITNCVVDVNAEGLVDTVFRSVYYTARQSAQKFGEDNLPDKIKKDLKNPKKSSETYEFLHYVGKNEDFDETRGDAVGKKYSSIWIYKKDKEIVKTGGYEEMPFHVARAEKNSKEIYGEAPGGIVLPTIKLVNKQQKTALKGAQKIVDPPTLLPNDGSISSWRNSPGALNYWNSANPESKPIPWTSGARPDIGMDFVKESQQTIKEAYSTDLFNALAMSGNSRMTATEVMERVDEKLTLLAPLLGRLQTELFSPMIKRVFNILLREGEFPEPPVEIFENDLELFDIVYLGKLAQALRQSHIRGFLGSVQALSMFIESKPEILDKINFDALTEEVLEANSVPSRIKNSSKTVKEIRKARAEAMQQQAQMQQAESASEAYKNTTKAPEKGSPLDALK